MTITIINNTAATVLIGDMGIYVGVSQQLDITNLFSLYEIRSSNDLKDLCVAESFSLIYNNEVLTGYPLDTFFDYMFDYGLSLSLGDTSTIYGDGQYTLSYDQFNAIQTTVSGGGFNSQSDIQFIFGGKDERDNCWEFKSTNFYTGRRFYFQGTDILKIPKKIKIVGYVQRHSIGYIQLYDYTNRRIISEIEFSNGRVEIITTEKIDEFPINEAILEIRGRVNINKRKGYLNSVTICF